MTRHRAYTEIEHPEAYANAVRASIHGRANAKRRNAWEAAHPHLAEWANYEGAIYSRDENGDEYASGYKKHRLGTFPAFARKSIVEWGAPSEKATATLQRIFDERTVNAVARDEQRAAEALTSQAWTAGRQVVEGVIVSSKWVDGFTGDSVCKILVKRDDGSRIYLTAPRPIWVSTNEPRERNHENGMCAIGDRVRFTVKVEPKLEEPTFAFGSRPTKGEIVNPILTETK